MSEKKKKILEILGWTLVVLVVLPTLTIRQGRTDLGLLRGAAGKLWHHQPVYELDQVNEHTKPPLATLASLVLLVIPQVLQERLWDVLNILAFLAWGKKYAFSRRHLLVGILFTLNAWNAEIRLGQFNLFTLWGVLWAAEGKSPARGMGLVLAILFKPVNVVLLPWVYRYGNRRGLLLSCVGALSILVGAYVGLFGMRSFLGDHLTWWRFLPASVDKHIFRTDNFGLPSLTAQLGGGTHSSFLWLILGLAVSWWVTRRDQRESALTWLVGISIVISPMAWLQNYSLLLGGNLLWLREYHQKRSFQIGVALLITYVFHQGWVPGVKPYLGVFADFRLPLISWLVASSLIVSSLLFQRHSDRRLSSD